jgi:hypothetical protein
MACNERLLAAALLLAVLLPTPAAPQGLPPLSEYEVKAGFLYNFAGLIAWPDGTPPALSLCIVGDDPFGAAKAAIDGKTIGDKSLTVRTAVPSTGLDDCQIVFLASSQNERVPAIVKDLRGSPVLTVGDRAGLAAQGLIVGFYREGDKVRFEINVDAARRAGLPISSRLLNLARIVHDAEAAR